jgi:hypothetical protein
LDAVRIEVNIHTAVAGRLRMHRHTRLRPTATFTRPESFATLPWHLSSL